MSWQSKLIRVEITKHLFDQAMNDTIKEHTRGHKKFDYFLTGRIAELALYCTLGSRASLCSEKNMTFDLVYVGEGNNKIVTIDVKSKKRNKDFPPSSSWDASITNRNRLKPEKPDYYAHASVHYDKGKCVSCYIIGFTKPSDYFDGAIERKVGDIDPTNGQTCMLHSWNKKYSSCIQFDDWIEVLKH